MIKMEYFLLITVSVVSAALDVSIFPGASWLVNIEYSSEKRHGYFPWTSKKNNLIVVQISK